MEINPNIDQEFQAEKKRFAYAMGYQIWQHYKKSKYYNLSQILDWGDQFQNGADADISLEKSQDIINRLHWNIYHGN